MRLRGCAAGGSCCALSDPKRRRHGLPKHLPADVLHAVQNSTKLTHKEVTSLYERFRQLAPSGEMSLIVFRGTMGMLGMLDDSFLSHRMFSAFDANKDGRLNFVEFSIALGTMIRGTDDEKLALAFKILSPLRRARNAPGVSSLMAFQNGSNANAASYTTSSSSAGTEDYQGISLFEFRNVVVSLESTRRQLIGGHTEFIDDRLIEKVFRQVASRQSDGTLTLRLEDFKHAVRTNPNFLCLLGVTLGPQDRRKRHSSVDEGLTEEADRSIAVQHKKPETSGSLVWDPSLYPVRRDICDNEVQTNAAETSCLQNASTNEPASLSSHFISLPASLLASDQGDIKMLNDVTEDSAVTPALPSSAQGRLSPPSLGLNCKGKSTPNTLLFSVVGRSSPVLDATTLIKLERMRAELRATLDSMSTETQLLRLPSPKNQITKEVLLEDSETPKQQSETNPTNVSEQDAQEVGVDMFCNVRSSASEIPDLSSSGALKPQVSVPVAAPLGSASVITSISRLGDIGEQLQSSSFYVNSNELCNMPSKESEPFSEPKVSVISRVARDVSRSSPAVSHNAQTFQINDELSSAMKKPASVHNAFVTPLGGLRRSVSYSNALLSSVPFAAVSGPIHEKSDVPPHETDDRPWLSEVQEKLTRLLNLVDETISQAIATTADESLQNTTLQTLTGAPTSKLLVADHAALDAPKPVGGSGFPSGTKTDIITPAPRMFMNRPNFERARKRQGSIAQLQQRIQRRRPEYKLLGPTKGFAVHFGHPSWNMVLNMMVGVRLAGGRISNEPRRAVEAYDFVMKEKISILPRSDLSTSGDPRSRAFRNVAVRFVDYAPMVFRKIRELFGLNSEEYLQSIGPEQLVGNMVLGNLASLSELCSEGKSGAFFYYSADGRYLIKTITRDAAKFLRHILKDYYEHIIAHPDTLVTRFYGYHAIRLKKRSGNVGAKLYFVIMGNVFHTPVALNRRYDLKGSWVGRTAGEAVENDASIALKDCDMVKNDEKIRIGSQRRDALLKAIENDATFFDKHMILDYSLLVGIHDKQIKKDRLDVDPVDVSQQPHNQFNQGEGTNVSSKPFHQEDSGGMLSSDGTVLYYLGIIDILTRWTAIKKLERSVKMLKAGCQASGVSCAHPSFYARMFVARLFVG